MQVFVFGAIIADLDYVMFKPEDSADFQELHAFIQDIAVDDLQALELALVKSYKGMMKAGAAKTADIMIA